MKHLNTTFRIRAVALILILVVGGVGFSAFMIRRASAAEWSFWQDDKTTGQDEKGKQDTVKVEAADVTPALEPKDASDTWLTYTPAADVETQSVYRTDSSNLVGLTGTLNIPGDYATLAAAITDLNTQGVGAGGVTFNVVAGNPQTAPAGGYVIGGAGSAVLTTSSAANPIVFTGNANTATAATPQTVGNINDAVFKLIGADFVTIQGFTIQENPANTIIATAATNNATEFGIGLFYVTTTDGAQNNTIQNNTITLNRAYANTFCIFSTTRASSTAVGTTADATTQAGTNSNTHIYTNNLSNANYAIVFLGSSVSSPQETGTDIGGAAAGTGNTITNTATGTAALSTYITLTGSNYAIFLNHQINDNVSFNSITTASVASAITIGGILKNYSVTNPTGTITTTINNNTVTATNNSTGTTTGTVIGINNQGLTTLLSTATMSMNNNTVQNSVLGGTTATTAGLTAITNLSLPGTMNMNGNSVINNAITATTAGGSGTLAGITNSGAAGTVNMNNNVVRSMASSAPAGQVQGIVNTGAVVTALNINNNQLGNATSGYFSTSTATSGTLFGVVTSGGASTCALSITGNDIRGITYNVAASAANAYYQNSAATLSQNISSNTFTNLLLNTTGSITFIADSVSLSATGTQNINSNSIVTAFNKTGAGGTITFFTSNASSVAGSTVNNNLNNFSNITVTGATTIAGWSNTDGGAPTKTIQSNTFTNITGGTSSVTALNVNFSGTANISLNTIGTITGSLSITGINLGSSNTTVNTFRNKIYDLQANTASGTVTGISIASTTTTTYNNLIGDLRTPAANASNPLIGISITGGTTANVYFNTVYLNATSTGAAFGSSAISVSTTPTVTLRNNIFDNTSTANTTGLTVAHRRSSTALATYASTSNNNDFYAGTPSATNLIFYDGTNAIQTIGAYKTFVSPRDANSFSENPPFLSTTGSSANFLHINTATPTQLESGGTAVAGITDDFDGQTRNVSTPDVGADEFTGTLLDLAAPVITYTPLSNTTFTTNRTLVVTITDATGVASGSLSPRIYFKKSTDASYVSTQCTLASGNAQNGTYNCTIDYSLVGGGSVTTGNTIQYFVVAQDTVGNITANPSAGFAATDVNNVTTPPTTPNSYLIAAAFPATVTVGTGGTYPSLTNTGGVFEAINGTVLTGNVTVNIISDLTGETGTVALNTAAEEGGGAGTYTVLIKPSGAARSVTGTGVNLIKLNGANRVTIDGSLTGGTDRSLTIENTNATTPSVVWFGSVGTTPITNDTLKNCIVRNGINSSSAVIISDAGTIGNAGFFSNITIQNDDIQKALIGVFASGGTTPQGGSNLTYTQNTLNTVGANAIRSIGLYMQGVNGATVSNNTVGNFDATNDESDTGIWLASGTINATVSGNTVSTIGYTGTSTLTPYGIRDSGGATASGNILTGNAVSNITANGTNTGGPTVFGIENSSGGTIIQRNNVQGVIATNTGTYGAVGINISAGNNVVIRNNFVSNVTGDMSGGAAFSTTFGIFGIRIATGTGHQIYHNSVNLYGLRSGTAATSLLTASVAIVSTASTGMDVRNNVFANNITGGTSSIANVSIYLPSGGTSAMNLTLNNNAYYYGTDATTQGAGQAGTTAGTNFFTTLTALKAYSSTLSVAGTNDNASLAFTTAPPFVSNNDLHLTGANPLLGAGVTIASVVTDIDNDLRDTPPDIGADEVVTGGRTGTVPAGTYRDANLGTSTLGGNVTVQGNLTLSGIASTGANTLIVDCGATASGASDTSYVDGNVQKNFCAPGSFNYPVGDPAANSVAPTNGYMPVNVTVTALAVNPSSLTVNANNGVPASTPPLNPATTLSAFWTLTETGDLTANLSFNYDQGDVNGNEANYRVIQIEGTTPFNYPSTVLDTTNNIATVNGIQNFSDWTVGEPFSPTNTTANISGHVLTGGGQPLAGVTMSLLDTVLVENRTTTTGADGSYHFDAITTGREFVVTPARNGYQFSPASAAFSHTGDRPNVDFAGTSDGTQAGLRGTDFDGDGKADLTVWRPADGTWYILQSNNGTMRADQWGVSGDKIVPADYDGDGKSDLAVYRPSNGTWYIYQSATNTLRADQWGIATDVVAPADYDGDGKADIAVWRGSTGTWYILQSANGQVRTVNWGTSGDKPVMADYDGDGKADVAVWRPSNSTFYIINSTNNQNRYEHWGIATDTVVVGDYDGDGKADLSVFRPETGTWYVKQSTDGSITSQSHGTAADRLVPADYDGDGKTDRAVWQSADGNWLVLRSTTNASTGQKWGANGDVPAPSAYVP